MAALDQRRQSARGAYEPVDYAAGGSARRDSRAGGSLAVGLVLAYLVTTIAVAVLLHFAGVAMRGNETTWDRAIFTSVNAASLTGFQQTVGIREMSAAGSSGPLILLALTFAGTLMSLIVGGLAAARILGMPHTPVQIVLAAFSTVLLTTVVGAAALSGAGRSIFEAVFQSASSFANSGLWPGPSPSITSVATFLVLLPLAVIGGLGLPVLIEVTDRIFGGPPLSRHSRTVLALAGWFYLGGLIVLVLAQIPAALGGGNGAWRNTLISCSVAAINTRSAGLPIQTPAAFTAASQWLLMLLMLIGAAPAGTAGGVKTTTLLQLGRGLRDALAGRTTHRVVGIAAIWTCSYLLALLIGLLLLLSVAPQIPADRSLFLACSALGNVGLSHDPISNVGSGLLVLSGLMLFGRLGPLVILWWTARTTSDVDVLVG